MTTTSGLPTAPTDTRRLNTDLPARVSAHMQTHFTDDTEAGGWTCARDHRDNTAVVVWRPAGDLLTTPRIRGLQLSRWLDSLRDAGFVGEPRTDMEVFGRPGEESPDGIARWLHITGWSEPVRAECAQRGTYKVQHTVQLDPAATPLLDTPWRTRIRPESATFIYHPNGDFGGMTVVAYAGEDGDMLADIPAWLREIGDAHREHAWDRSWCYLDRPNDEPSAASASPALSAAGPAA
jgi:hypothetical protein